MAYVVVCPLSLCVRQATNHTHLMGGERETLEVDNKCLYDMICYTHTLARTHKHKKIHTHTHTHTQTNTLTQIHRHIHLLSLAIFNSRSFTLTHVNTHIHTHTYTHTHTHTQTYIQILHPTYFNFSVDYFPFVQQKLFLKTEKNLYFKPINIF